MLRHEVKLSELQPLGYDISSFLPEAEFHSSDVYQYFNVRGELCSWAIGN